MRPFQTLRRIIQYLFQSVSEVKPRYTILPMQTDGSFEKLVSANGKCN